MKLFLKMGIRPRRFECELSEPEHEALDNAIDVIRDLLDSMKKLNADTIEYDEVDGPCMNEMTIEEIKAIRNGIDKLNRIQLITSTRRKKNENT
jgi:endonuclease IV